MCSDCAEMESQIRGPSVIRGMYVTGSVNGGEYKGETAIFFCQAVNAARA